MHLTFRLYLKQFLDSTQIFRYVYCTEPEEGVHAPVGGPPDQVGLDPARHRPEGPAERADEADHREGLARLQPLPVGEAVEGERRQVQQRAGDVAEALCAGSICCCVTVIKKTKMFTKLLIG